MKNFTILIATLLFCLNTYCQKYNDVVKLFGKNKYDKALTLSLKYLEKDTASTMLNMIAGRAYTKKYEYNKAIPYLLKGSADKNTEKYIKAWSLADLGVCYYMTNEYKKSKTALETCININATANVNKFARKKMLDYFHDDIYKNWVILETKHIRFHFQDTSVIKNTENYILKREIAYLKSNEFFEAQLTDKIDFYVWNTRKDIKKTFGSEAGFANSYKKEINAHFKQTPGHEITHILSDLGLSPTKKTALINEGIAVYFNFTSTNRIEIAKSELKDKKISIKELWEHPQNFQSKYIYLLGGAFVEYLANNGTQEQLKELLKNQTYKNARTIYNNLNQLIKEFENTLYN